MLLTMVAMRISFEGWETASRSGPSSPSAPAGPGSTAGAGSTSTRFGGLVVSAGAEVESVTGWLPASFFAAARGRPQSIGGPRADSAGRARGLWPTPTPLVTVSLDV